MALLPYHGVSQLEMQFGAMLYLLVSEPLLPTHGCINRFNLQVSPDIKVNPVPEVIFLSTVQALVIPAANSCFPSGAPLVRLSP